VKDDGEKTDNIKEAVLYDNKQSGMLFLEKVLQRYDGAAMFL
jgi:hypothetical protein